MVLEVSGNYSIILPVILANTIAYVISRVLQPVPIFEELNQQDGLYLPSMEEQREVSNLHLEDALKPVTVPVLQGSDTIADTIKSLAQYHGNKPTSVVLVQCSDGLWYSAAREELEAILSEVPDSSSGELLTSASRERSTLTLEQRLGSERTPILFPDLPLSSALPHFQRWPLLPIANRAIRGSLEGAVLLEDVLNRYHQQRTHSH
jgi:CIC family chloride channel protein